MALTTVFGAHPDVRVLEFLAQHPEFDYNLSELARNADVSRPTAYKVVARLTKRGILARTRRVGASWFYRLNPASPLVKPLLDASLALEDAAAPAKRRRLPARRTSS
jgi:DNA-binding IclR family transcriptional regulator